MDKTTFSKVQDFTLNIGIRVIILILAIYLSYKFVDKVLVKGPLTDYCLINTENCVKVKFYKYGNTFIAQLYPSEIYVFFNGTFLYVYGQTTGQCPDLNYEPVNAYTLSSQPGRVLGYTRLQDQCIQPLNEIVRTYETNFRVKPQYIYINKGNNLVNVLNVFEILNYLYQNNYFSL